MDGYYLQIIISVHFCFGHKKNFSDGIFGLVLLWFGFAKCMALNEKLGCILNAENGNSNALNMHEMNKNSVGV